MKRIVSLTIALFLVLGMTCSGVTENAVAESGTEKSGFAALEKADKVVAVRNHLRDFLARNDVDYKYDVDYDSFDFTLSVENVIGKVDISMFVYDDCIVSCGYLPFDIKEENRIAMERFTTLLNEQTFYGHFIMLHGKSTIYFRCFQHIESALPGDEEMNLLATLPRDYIEVYGEYISDVAVKGKDPMEVYEAIQAEEDE